MKVLNEQSPLETYQTVCANVTYDWWMFQLLCCIVVKTTVFLSLFHAMLPCLPRCGSGFSGLKDQGVTNFIVLKFITEYNSLFLKENETSPYDVTLGQVCPSYTHGYQSFQNILGFSEILLLKKMRHFNWSWKHNLKQCIDKLLGAYLTLQEPCSIAAW